jgi:four helix bundle protein
MTDDGEIRSYRDLRVWKEAMDLAVESYAITKRLPRDEIFGLVSQIRRAAASVPANIAEGYGRDSAGSYVHHLKVAQGSLKELETHFILSGRVGLLGEDVVNGCLEKTDAVGRMLRGLIRSMRTQAEKM